MNANALLYLVVTLTIGLIGWGLLVHGRIYRFTVLFASAFLGFAIPQMIGLSNETSVLAIAILPEGAFDLLCFVCMLCLVGVWLGDNRGVHHPGVAPIATSEDYDLNWLIRFAVLLNVAGIVIFQIMLRYLADEEHVQQLGTQWTGPITIMYFFQSMQKYGFALALLLYLRTRSVVCLFCSLFNVIATLISFTYIARRGGMADTVFVTLLGLYFGRRILVPAWVLGVMLAIGTLLSNCIGSFRGNLEKSFMEKLEETDIIGEFNETLTTGGYELANAAINIWCADQQSEFDFGAVHWNQLVHAYFPGQIFGADTKKMIQFETHNLPFEMRGYRPPPGTTQTGMADAFCSFWYLGFLKYYVIGYVMGRWWNRANRGDLKAQLAYMVLMSSALHTISHGTYWLFNNYVHMVIFAYPCLHLAKYHRPKSEPAGAEH